MRKIVLDNLNEGMLSKNFKATVHQFLAPNKAYSFMSSIKVDQHTGKAFYLRF